ncbi:hypothetical protein JTB14_014481 [Gonioctena quinquepunctata]|nr:hypothetical protein JTB14_014481 [Gonioctena quinquepunctata]
MRGLVRFGCSACVCFVAPSTPNVPPTCSNLRTELSNFEFRASVESPPARQIGPDSGTSVYVRARAVLGGCEGVTHSGCTLQYPPRMRLPPGACSGICRLTVGTKTLEKMEGVVNK